MKRVLRFKKYKRADGVAVWDKENQFYHGDIVFNYKLCSHDLATFQGKTAEEAELEFKRTVDDYLTWLNELRTKSFREYVKKRLSKKEIEDIDKEVEKEIPWILSEISNEKQREKLKQQQRRAQDYRDNLANN